jgi:hypothetical protein
MMTQNSGLQGKDEADRRSAARVTMLLRATIRYDDLDPSVTTRVLDLSNGGMRTTLPVPLERGHRVTVIMKGVGEIRAKIAWNRGGEVGIKFDRKIDKRLVIEALTGAPAASHIEFAKSPVPRPGFRIR